VRLDLAGVRRQAATTGVPPLLRALVRTPARRAAQAASGGAQGTVLDGLLALPAAERRPAVLELVRGQVAAVLGFASTAEVPADRAFRELGFDSLTAVEFRNQLGAAVGQRLPATVVFDHPNSADLADHLLTTLPGGNDAGRSVAEELDVLESMLAESEPEGGERLRVVTRLQALLARLGDGRGGEQGDGAGVAVTEVIDDAGDDDLFDFIGREFGIS
ncbi:phosphopantetheine-binding protein, partial [Kitasatospora sp. NPDC059648]|uniref:phosphopantetheine-binding protein n=1 Tax=Kitasatospora sp. NPDC059648 TaxID=3346894 RepID=UPI0036BF2849